MKVKGNILLLWVGEVRETRAAFLKMAVNFNDPTCGFYEREVVDFINKQIIRNGVTSSFYRLKTCKSWGDVEKKLGDILRDSAVSGAIKESCAWSTLALAVRFAQRQKQEYSEKVKRLQDLIEEQKLYTNVLVGMVNRLRDLQEKERQKAQLELKQNLAALQGAEEERNLLRNQLLKVLNTQSQTKKVIQEEKRKEEPQTLDKYAFANSAANYGAGGQAMTSSVQETTVTPATTAPEGEAKEQKVLSVWSDDQKVALSYSDILRTWAQSGSVIPVNLPETSYSFLPTFTVLGAAAETAAKPLVEDTRKSWKGKQCDTRKFFPDRFNPQSGLSRPIKRIRRREGDWDCDQCNSMNFSWRKMCYKCKKISSDKGKEDFDPN
ncbi:putative testis-expressed protein 13C [Galemys pyrenaicus]|uniref:Putative testis-expressed protein 13C n=1 Tax=Galemys pyrenaicus TaxID=202257 RepID=A0A8J6DLI9_GALPY|nr:putative testis-expressed protein 13C [Galemys pyrenaicus]